MTGESYLTGSTHEDKNGLNKGIGPKKVIEYEDRHLEKARVYNSQNNV